MMEFAFNYKITGSGLSSNGEEVMIERDNDIEKFSKCLELQKTSNISSIFMLKINEIKAV